MVDPAFVIRPDPEMKSAIREILRGEPKEAQSVNQTMHAPLRMCPFAISVGTNPPFSGGETTDVQLAFWAGAGLPESRQLLPPDQMIQTTPTLAAHGHELHLLALQRKGDENMIYGRPLGGTETLLETIQMLRSLDLLVWMSNDYRFWYIEHVLTPR